MQDSQRACPSSPRSKLAAAEAQVKTAHRLCRLCCLTQAELLPHGLLQCTQACCQLQEFRSS